ncbi:lipid A biosynthesis lauroyl acyltransferase [Lutibaculum baratangense]|uniref:Lipid A biosynthesis lauroyl acyltransferase n=1 Tax=Lutibaculum baratangense AMV1 TaxID=631454 RepID=V4RLZ0_9HYPH|nr:lipid A biosynthesis lauroyl acyltransferase [Lutibaculum baratangense]ESR24260.1 Lipid A biosynthesis lauroyl acyltransferase [Lutibaculum baratangense AMV1]
MKRLKYRYGFLLLRLRHRARAASQWLAAKAVVVFYRLVRTLGPDRASDLGGRVARRFGPLLPTHRIGRENIAHAFPEKSEAEREAILRDAWENLGRTGAEYPHLAEIWDFDPENPGAGRTEVQGLENFMKLKDDGKPAIIFSAHLANWELPAVCAARHGLPVTAVYRTPNNARVAQEIAEIREGTMGELLAAGSGQAVAFSMAAVLQRGGHLGMLADQRLTRGLKIPFFGRIAPTNPTLARLARQFDCPVHGARVVRLPGNRFRVELTDELTLPRDEAGLVDVEATMRLVNETIEGWVREHPGQWLWFHRRWRQPERERRRGRG